MIVIARNFGQLGNRLLLSAHLIAAAREYGVTLLNPSFAEYARYFPSIAHDLWCRYPRVPSSSLDSVPRPPTPFMRLANYKLVYLGGKLIHQMQRFGCPLKMIRLKGEQSCDLGSEQFQRLAQARLPVLVSGWQFRSGALLDKHADAVREHYRISADHQARIRELIGPLRQSHDVVVGVHIRQGDYARFQNGRYFYSVSQYVAAMKRIRDRFGDQRVAFLVCGNASFDPADFRGLDFRFGTGHLIEDLYGLAETDLLVGPPSTFTDWASFYGKKPLQFMRTADQSFDDVVARVSESDQKQKDDPESSESLATIDHSLGPHVTINRVA